MTKTFTRPERHALVRTLLCLSLTNQDFANLNVSPFDSFEVPEKVACFKRNRVRLLNEIASWIANTDSRYTFLDGVPGIGKESDHENLA
jgi:hypothetical protein